MTAAIISHNQLPHLYWQVRPADDGSVKPNSTVHLSTVYSIYSRLAIEANVAKRQLNPKPIWSRFMVGSGALLAVRGRMVFANIRTA